MTADKELTRFERRLSRERAARKQAEELLEVRSRELWQANSDLRAVQSELEDRVRERTAELDAALAFANRASEAKTRFLAHMSHELRTPLTAILGYTEDLIAEAPGLDDLVVVERNARHLLALINEILDLAKVESGTLELRPETTNLHDLLEDLQTTFEPRLADKGVRYRSSIDPAVPVHAVLDPLRVKQILINLLGNALKFTEVGVVALRAYCPEGPHSVRLDVLDTGCGIDPDVLQSLFEPFTQVEGTRGGTGLGLAITRQLAEIMGGSVTATSTPGRGSCFSLTIPIVHSVPVVSEVREEEAPRPADFLAGVTLLLADDSVDSRRLVGRWCRAAGAEVIEVDNGEAAVREASQAVQLVLMDMQMPILGGDEATRVLRESGFDKPIVALTANSMAGDRQAALAAGCTGYLAKPIDRKTLLDAIDRFLTG